MERTASARRRGAVDVAMISFMQDARLRVSEAPELVWGVSSVRGGGSGCVCLGRWLGRARLRHETEPDSHTDKRSIETGRG